MKHPSRPLVTFLLLAIALQACNLPGGPPTQQPLAPGTDEPISLDIDTALTLAAQTIAAGWTSTPIPSQTPTQGPPTSTPVVGVTLSVSSETNCRFGPSTDYEIIMVMKPGMTAAVVGKYGGQYWIIEYPGGFGAKCWLWGAYATVIGDTSTLVEGVPPPLPPTPTPVPAAPAAPKNVHTNCTSKNVSSKSGDLWIIKFEWTVKIIWKDNSGNEDGFSVYKDGSLLANVGPNQTSYTDVFTRMLMLAPTTYVYGVQSYNDYGASDIKDAEISTCE